MVDTRMSSVDAVGLEIDAAVLRQAFLGDVHPRHDLQARDDGVLETQQIFRHGHGHEQAVDAVADAQLALLRLEVDVRRLSTMACEMTSVTNRTTAASSSTTSSASFCGLRGEVAFVAVVERTGADAEVLDDELVDALRHGEMPDQRPRREGAHPVGHGVVRQPGGGEMERRSSTVAAAGASSPPAAAFLIGMTW
jgi:hypothetical protein